MSENAEVTIEKNIPTSDNPVEFMKAFNKSDLYKEKFDQYFKGKIKSEPTSEDLEDMNKVFLESNDAKAALIDFGTQHLKFHYNSSSFPQESRKAIQNYVATVEDIAKMVREGTGASEILSLDSMRSQYHDQAASVLVKEGVVPTTKIGRSLARLILIDKNLDTADTAKEPDINRVMRKFGGR